MRTQTNKSSFVRHSTSQETPVPIFIGLMLHAQTRKKEVVDRMFNLGISMSYDRVLRLSAEIGNTICQHFHMEQVVYPPTMRSRVFTTAAVDNIDHNLSATTAKNSFHGTGISLQQHHTSVDAGLRREISIIGGNAGSRKVGPLSYIYTNVPPVASSVKQPVPKTSLTSLKRNDFKKYAEGDYRWLVNARYLIEQNSDKTSENISWAAYHSRYQDPGDRIITRTALLPLFQVSAHTAAMIKHSMDVVKCAVEHLNTGQTPVLTFDQPLYALAKQIQWKWPNKYGENLFVVMFGGLHIEMAALKIIGNWLQGSGWTQALVQANITRVGKADSLCRATHVMRTRKAHQITAVALYILQHRAYDQYSLTSAQKGQTPVSFEVWCNMRKQCCPQFNYWTTVMQLEVCILTYVRSLREAHFLMYLDALTELVPWLYALDHTNYARWIPVHLRDMTELPKNHPDVFREFNSGHFTVQKTKRVFSPIPIDQAHEQNNACVKGDGGAVGLIDDPGALRGWMVAGPEIARLIEEFENTNLHWSKGVDTHHDDQTESVQISFTKDVRSLVTFFEDKGNQFMEESQDLLVLDTKEIVGPEAVKTVLTAKIGQEQFDEFTKERLIERTESIHDIIRRNKLPLFGTSVCRAHKGKQQLTNLKNNVELFSRLYIGCQNRDGNIDEFFRHENQSCPPSLSDVGRLHIGTRSDLLVCLEDLSEAQSEAPSVTIVVLDGAAIIQMLKPGAAKTFEEYANQMFLPYISVRN